MKSKNGSLFVFAILALSLAWPHLALAQPSVVIASRDTTLVNRFVEDVLTKVYARLGIQVTYKLFPGAQSVTEANQGRADGEAARLQTVLGDYPNLRLVPVPLFMSDLSAFVHADTPADIDGWDSMAHYTTTTIDGFKFVKNKLAPYNPMIVQTTQEAVTLVETQQKQVAVLNRFLGVLAVAKTKAKNVKVVNPPLHSLPVYHLVHKKHETLVPKLADVMTAMKEDGSLDLMWKEFVNREVRKAYGLK